MSLPTEPSILTNKKAATNPFLLLQSLSIIVILGIIAGCSLTVWYLYHTVYRNVRMIANIPPEQVGIPRRSVRNDLLEKVQAYDPTSTTPRTVPVRDPFTRTGASTPSSQTPTPSR